MTIGAFVQPLMNSDDPLMSLNKTFRGEGIHIIDIPDGQADAIRVKIPDCNDQMLQPTDHIHIQNLTSCRGVRVPII